MAMKKLFYLTAALVYLNCTIFKGHGRLLSEKDLQIWKNDSCGIHNFRYPISLKIIANRHALFGMEEKELEKMFGKPDFIREYDMFNYPNTIQLEYSTSSLEIDSHGKCGDPITHSLSFVVSKKDRKVVGIEEFIY